jgi:hypothetical protein
MIRLEELIRDGGRWILASLYLNPAWVIKIEEDANITRDLRCPHTKSKFPEGLDERHTVTKITYACGSSIERAMVIGAPDTISNKVTGQKQLLRG